MTRPDAPLFDPTYLAELDAMLGRAVTDTLVAPMLAELARTPDAIADFVSGGDVAAARSAAHGLRGAALGLGCLGVADACTGIEAAPADALSDMTAALVPIATQTAVRLREVRGG